MSPKGKRQLHVGCEKGASTWLNVLPLSEERLLLSKSEFRDALAIRFDLRVRNLPIHCVCSQLFTIDHAMGCKTGGYIAYRHDSIRNILAKRLEKVTREVGIEPHLQPLTGEPVSSASAITTDAARLDIVASGFWAPTVRTYFDVRVFHPNCPSYLDKHIKNLHSMHENEKRRAYNDRVINIERGTFTPLVFSSAGGMSVETTRFMRRLALLTSQKLKQDYNDVIRDIRISTSFSLLRSAIAAVRGTRKPRLEASYAN